MATAPYPNLENVLVYTRVRVNDAIVAVGGQTLVDTFAFTPYYVNLAWRMFQQYLISLGWSRFLVMNDIILSLPAVNSPDTSLICTLSWSGYSSGGTVASTPVLPQNLVRPVKLAERPSGQAPNIAAFIDMDGPEQGIARIPSAPKQQWNQIWTWDNDQILLPGALAATDIRIDFQQYLADFTGTGNTFPGAQVVPILNCEDAFSGFIAYVFCEPRGDLDAGSMLANARDASAILAGKPLPSEAAQAAQQGAQ